MIDRINRWLSLICQIVSGVSFCFMAGIAFADSISRMINRPLLGGSEYVEFALLVFFFSSLTLAVRGDTQIRVGLLADLYKPRLQRMEGLFTSFGELLALYVLSYLLFDQAGRLDRFGTLSSYFRVPVAPWVYFAAFLSLIAIWFAFQNFWRKRNGVTPRPHAIPDEDT